MGRTIKDVMDFYKEMESGHAQESYYPHSSTPVRRKKASMVFIKSEITDDIAQLAYVEGDVMPADNAHDRHQVMDIVEDGNADRMSRVIALAVDECREMLYPYTKVPVDDEEEEDNILEEEQTYTIELLLPDDFSKTTLEYMEKLVHEYLVCKAMAEWMGIANLNNRNSAANWAEKAETTKGKIKGVMNARMHRVRRTQTPF